MPDLVDELIEAARARLVTAALDLAPGRRARLRLVAFRVKAAALLLALAYPTKRRKRPQAARSRRRTGQRPSRRRASRLRLRSAA